jgi:glycine/D-amino acid oxidase-like deaminating enzyme
MKIAIVGAGISGLTTAFYLHRARPDWELVIFDRASAPGGTMHSAKWQLGAGVTAISRDGRRYTVEARGSSHSVDRVVISAPSLVAADIVRGLDAELADLIAASVTPCSWTRVKRA